LSTAYLNGEFIPIENAKVPVMDRGFLFGDGVYEVLPVYSRKPFRLDQHLARLQASLDGIRLNNPNTDTEWKQIVERMIAEAPSDDQSLYLQITRGVDTRRNHAFPAVVRPTIFMMSEALNTPSVGEREQGVTAISAADIRWLRCDLKTTSLLANCLLRQMAVTAGCVETVMFRDGVLTEGAASNIFVVKNNVLLAPIKNHLMLPGVTYDVVLELAALYKLQCEVRDIREDELRNADELWLTSSTKEVLPIVSLDGEPIGNGRPGPVFAQMYGWYQAFKKNIMRMA
jgi:D-alanine transaminase